MGTFQEKFFKALEEKCKVLGVDVDTEFSKVHPTDGTAYLRVGFETITQFHFQFDLCRASISLGKPETNYGNNLNYIILYSSPLDTTEKFFDDLQNILSNTAIHP